MKIIETTFPGILIFEPRVFSDARGVFFESWRRNMYAEAGASLDFVQDNLSTSYKGVVRGLHFQNPRQQSKLVYVADGEVFDVAVDVRTGSPTFGKWFGAVLSSENRRQMYIPKGFAHGFQTLSEKAVFTYKCDDYYSAEAELCVRWDDPAIGIDWPIKTPILSPKDGAAPTLHEIEQSKLPAYAPDQIVSN